MNRTTVWTLVFVTLFALGNGCTTAPDPKSSPPGTPGPVSNVPIPDLPDYPGAKRISYTSVAGPQRAIRAELGTGDSFDEVIKFYGNAQRENGWKPLTIESSSASADETRMVFVLRKDAATARIEINQKGKGDVSITLERKD